MLVNFLPKMGYKPKKRIKKEDVLGLNVNNIEINSCLLNIDKNSGKISVGKSSSILNSNIDTANVVIKIRTESFDETPATFVSGVKSLPDAFCCAEGYGSLQTKK